FEDVRVFEHVDRRFVTGNFDLKGDGLHLVSTVAEFDALGTALDDVATIAQDAPSGRGLVVDIYLDWPDQPADGDALVETLRTELSRNETITR
ncbi:hypothetical protein, partial [Staphylococcus aureus]